MSFGKLYTYEKNARSTHLLAIAKENNLDIEVVDTTVGQDVKPEYLEINPLGQVPTFVGANGFTLSETIAITVFFASQNEKTTLLGRTKEDYALILKWMSFANSAFLPKLGAWFRPLIGKDAYNKKNVDAAQADTEKLAGILDKHLLSKTFLVGERITAADLFVASIVRRGYEFVFGAEFRNKYPNLTRWYTLIANFPSFKAVAGEPEFIAEAVKYTPPKKEKPAPAPKAEKPAPAPKAAEPEDEPVEEKKPAKHPLEALGRSTFVLDEWKRKYSNEDTRTGALPWFWQNYPAGEYTLWKVDYKYPEELTQVFMSSNLIGGFFARLEASRKFIFGSLSVYGESNNSIITGAFLIRGDKHEPAFDVAPDWESYSFSPLDPANPEDKAFVEDVWTWDKDIQGKPHADGKVFK